MLFEAELSFTPESRGKTPVLQLRWKHNINGRGVYADGALDALRFLRGRAEVGKVSLHGRHPEIAWPQSVISANDRYPTP